jgi:transcriptional regulator with XRE-family HTH domain
MKYRNDVYIGKKIQQIFNERKISKSQFAQMICISRASIYNLFDAKSIDIDKLILISEVLDYPFLEEYKKQNSADTNTQIILEIEIKNGKCNVKQIDM